MGIRTGSSRTRYILRLHVAADGVTLSGERAQSRGTEPQLGLRQQGSYPGQIRAGRQALRPLTRPVLGCLRSAAPKVLRTQCSAIIKPYLPIPFLIIQHSRVKGRGERRMSTAPAATPVYPAAFRR